MGPICPTEGTSLLSQHHQTPRCRPCSSNSAPCGPLALCCPAIEWTRERGGGQVGESVWCFPNSYYICENGLTSQQSGCRCVAVAWSHLAQGALERLQAPHALAALIQSAALVEQSLRIRQGPHTQQRSTAARSSRGRATESLCGRAYLQGELYFPRAAERS